MHVYELNISAQTEGDTGYDYNDAYEEEYEDESCKYYIDRHYHVYRSVAMDKPQVQHHLLTPSKSSYNTIVSSVAASSSSSTAP